MNQISTSKLLHQYIKEHPEISQYLGEQLFDKVVNTCNYEPINRIDNLNPKDCIAYMVDLISNIRVREKSVIYDNLAKFFPDIVFVEIYEALGISDTDFDNDIDYLGDVDYLGYVGEKAFGIQIKPTTAKANFGNYSVSERMKNSFVAFAEDFSGKVFIVFSLDGEIGNPEIIQEIAGEIARLRA